jgi:hypothetical protein
MACLDARNGVFMANGMADGKPRKSGGEGIHVCPKDFVPWVLTLVLGKLKVMVKGGYQFSLVTRAHF